jgi:hypothetical protein
VDKAGKIKEEGQYGVEDGVTVAFLRFDANGRWLKNYFC